MKTGPDNLNTQQSIRASVPPINRKTVLAIGLVLLMIFMWIRVFLNKGKSVGSVKGSIVAPQINNITADKEAKLIRKELEFIPGRHDVLSHDMFADKKCSMEKTSTVTVETDTVDLEVQKSTIADLAGGLKLDAIILDPRNVRNQVFINGKLLMVGNILKVDHEGEDYDLTVVDIFQNKVELRCKGLKVSVKMLRADEKK